jgi:hypothetical protein
MIAWLDADPGALCLEPAYTLVGPSSRLDANPAGDIDHPPQNHI